MQYQVRTTQELATTVRNLRLAKNMTQADLATRAGVSRKWISDLESGRSSLRLTKVLILLDALDISLTLQERAKPSIDLDDLLGLDNPRD